MNSVQHTIIPGIIRYTVRGCNQLILLGGGGACFFQKEQKYGSLSANFFLRCQLSLGPMLYARIIEHKII